MADSYFKMNGNVMIQRKSGIDSQFFHGPNHDFEIRAENSPITGTTNSSEDNATSDQLAIYSGNTKLWGITEGGWVQNPNVPAFYGSNITPSTVNRFARSNTIFVNIGNHITHVSPDGNERTRFNAPITGLYYSWMGNIGTSSAGTLRMHFYINGIQQYAQLRTAQTTNHGTSASMVGIFEMSAGDYLEWYSYDNYGWYNNIYSHIGCYLIG